MLEDRTTNCQGRLEHDEKSSSGFGILGLLRRWEQEQRANKLCRGPERGRQAGFPDEAPVCLDRSLAIQSLFLTLFDRLICSDSGSKKGDRVGIAMRNYIQFPLIFFGSSPRGLTSTTFFNVSSISRTLHRPDRSPLQRLAPLSRASILHQRFGLQPPLCRPGTRGKAREREG